MKLIDCSCIVYLIEHLSKWRSNVSNWLGFHCLSNVLLIVYPWFNPCFNRESPINRGFKRKITYICMYSIYIYICIIYTYLIYLYNIYSTHIAQISGYSSMGLPLVPRQPRLAPRLGRQLDLLHLLGLIPGHGWLASTVNDVEIEE